MLARRVVFLATCAACAPTPRHPIAVAVLLDGERAAAPAASAVGGLELHAAVLPPTTPSPVDPTPSTLARARTAYATGDHAGCRTAIATLDLPSLLATGHRAAAARALSLDAACAYQGLAQDDARRAAIRLAGFGLDLPADAVAREVEDLILDEIQKASAAPRVRLAVTGQAGGRVSTDGQPATCAIPCQLELAVGEHVIAVDTDGYEPAWKTVRVPDRAELAIAQQPASPARASAQWRARIGRGLQPADDVGANLLALAAHEPRIAYLHVGDALTGTLIVDGDPRARGADGRDAAPHLIRELAYDGGLLQRPRVWQRPWFWIALAGGALAVSGAIVYLTYQPEIRTMVEF